MRVGLFVAVVGLTACGPAARAGFPADTAAPGDAMIREYLARDAAAVQAGFLDGVATADDWTKIRPRLKREYLDMLGLDPLPERTPLRARVTGSVVDDGFVFENLHYQSVPGLYVTANLYRPLYSGPIPKLPAVLYVCGHSDMGRDGCKAAYQANAIWLAKHGYVCLVVDTVQLGEIRGIHHGTYREGRWWWHSRGYTPAGVECWNGVRGIDYLVSRPDVDPDRIGVTGISGGGAATFWVAAADDRVKAAVPISGMADLVSYVGDRVVNGHCDCMFLYNTYRWPWLNIAGLIAPRPLLFVNSDHDRIFPMDANERVIAGLERLYSRFGAGDRVDAVVSMGGHAYREDIRRAAFRFLNTHLKDDPRPVTDSEDHLVEGTGPARRFPIEPKRLRAFPNDSDIPADQKNTTIDRHFVPVAKVDLPAEGGYDAWRAGLLRDLRRRSFRTFPDRVPPARAEGDAGTMTTEEGITAAVRPLAEPEGGVKRVWLAVSLNDERPTLSTIRTGPRSASDAAYAVQPRGVGPTRWTRKSPPNTVARSHALLGRTVDAGRVWDVAAVARRLRERYGNGVRLVVSGAGAAGVLGAYAALIEPDIDEVVAIDPPASHMDDGAPQLLGVLRVLDVPEAIGLLAPRPLTLSGGADPLRARVAAVYERAGAGDRLKGDRGEGQGTKSEGQ